MNERLSSVGGLQAAEKLRGVILRSQQLQMLGPDTTWADLVEFHEHKLNVLEEIAADPPAEIADRIDYCVGVALCQLWEIRVQAQDAQGGG
jgi:hypothetical protein